MRSPEGGYSERHLPISEDRGYTLTARERDEVFTPGSGVDDHGVAARGGRLDKLRGRLSTLMYADNVQKPTRGELEDARHHAEHEAEPSSPASTTRHPATSSTTTPFATRTTSRSAAATAWARAQAAAAVPTTTRTSSPASTRRRATPSTTPTRRPRRRVGRSPGVATWRPCGWHRFRGRRRRLTAPRSRRGSAGSYRAEPLAYVAKDSFQSP